MIRSIFSHVTSLVMALLFAGIVWAVATDVENPSHQGVYPEQLPIELVNRSESLMVYKQTENKARVTLRAPQASWDELRPASFSVTADLQGLDAGLHQVALQVQVTDPRVTVVDVDPRSVGIQLERLKSRDFDVRSEVLDDAPLGYTFKAPTVTPPQVKVSGPALLMDQVAEVSADLYLRGAKAPLEREVPVQLRDAQNNPVQGVTVTPSTVVVKVQVEQRVGYKDVSIKTLLKGSVAPGYWISNILVAPSTATIVGSPDVLAKIPGFVETLPIDVSGATAEVTKRAALSLPEGVSVLNVEGFTVQVSVTPIMGGQTVRRKVVLQGLPRGLSATISPDSVEVILSGPLPSLQSLSTDDVQVVVDAAGLTPGTYPFKPRVPVTPASLKVQNIVPDTVQVVITGTLPTVTPTVTPTAIPTATPTATR